jgi:hypothetical protein
MNSLFPQKNSLFFWEQGICLQRLEIAKQFPLLRITGNLPVKHWNYYRNWRPEAPSQPRIRKNSLLNSLFSGNLRITADPFPQARLLVGFEFSKTPYHALKTSHRASYGQARA